MDLYKNIKQSILNKKNQVFITCDLLVELSLVQKSTKQKWIQSLNSNNKFKTKI
jgi:hypothetical protein